MVMDLNKLHYTIAPGTADWWLMNAGFLLASVLVFGYAYLQKSFEKRALMARGMAAVMLLNFILHHVYFSIKGSWTLQGNLPLHLCSMSAIIAMYTLYTRSAAAYEFLIYWSAGAVHSFLTPELTHGNGTFEMADYCISHGGIILSGLYCSMFLGLRPSKKGWVRVFFLTQLCLPVIGLVNWVTNSNYMYISQRPDADNPLIIGEWPWYILVLEGVMLIHFVVFYYLHTFIARHAETGLFVKKTF